MLLVLSVLCGCRGAVETHTIARIAFGSCAQQDEPQPIWDSIRELRPDLFLFIGDNIYADTEDMAVMQSKYAQLNAQPGYRRLCQTCPVLATWDDHDYGVNDGGADYPKRVESQRQFLEAFSEPADSPRWQRPGVYEARVFGPPGRRVQIILLDTRYFRGPLTKKPDRIRGEGPYAPSTDTTASMLGEAQWRWLSEQLRLPAELRIIASSIQVVAEDHGYEKWANLPHERQQLFRLIRECDAAGVLFVSGDRHLAELSVMDGGVGYPVFDLTSSGLNTATKKWRPLESNRFRAVTMNFGDNFGLIEVDWNQPDPPITLQIRDVEGRALFNYTIPLSLLQPT